MAITIDDAYAHFETLHGPAAPERSEDELREEIHRHGLRYEEIDETFWDYVFAGWAYGSPCTVSTR